MAERQSVPVRVATLRDVAQRAGVDVSTASRALTGRRRVTPSIERKVRSAATALGYRPNEAARNLRLSKTMTLGLVLPRFTTPQMFDFLDGLGSGIEEHGYSLMLTIARGDPEHYRTLVQRLFERRVDGLFLSVPPQLGSALEPYESARVPVLDLFSHGAGPSTVPLLTASEEEALGRALARLAELGHRRTLHIGIPDSVSSVRAHWLERAANAAAVELVDEVVTGAESDDELLATLRRRLGGDQFATAIFTDLGTLPRLMRLLGALDMQVPEDVSVVSFGESQWSLELGLAQASIRHDTRALGQIAATTMMKWLAGERPPDKIDAGVGEWVERGTVGPAPASP